MKLFEDISQITKDNFWYRYYCTETKKSIFEKVQINEEHYYLSKDQNPLPNKDEDAKRYRSLIGNKYLDKQESKGFTEPYGSFNKIYKFIRDNHWSATNDSYNKTPKGFYFDIETRSQGVFPDPKYAKQEIVVLQIYDNVKDHYYIIADKSVSNNFYKDDRTKKYKNCTFIIEKDEKKRILAFCDLIQTELPLYVTAWNGKGFDFPYMYNRMVNLKLDPRLLSPIKQVKLQEKEINKKPMYNLVTGGIYYIDLMDVYKKFILAPRSSFALDNIAEIELNETKVQHNEYERFDDFYTGNYKLPYKPTDEQKNSSIYKAQELYLSTKDEKYRDLVKTLSWDDFIYYSIKDVELIYKLDTTLALITKMIYIAEKMGTLMNDTLGTIKPWACYIANTAFLENCILPRDTDHKNAGTNKGGFVRDTIPGRHYWTVSTDISSMYPNGIIFSNMSPETYISPNDLPKDLRSVVLKYFNNENEDERIALSPSTWDNYTSLLKKYNYSGTITGAVFKRDKQGLVPRLISALYQERKEVKGKMLQIQSEVQKLKAEGKDYTDLQELSNSYDILQHVLKILMNSLYGALGNQHMQIYNLDIAKAITGNGRAFIKELAINIRNKLNSIVDYKDADPIIAGDTDSVYFTLEPIVNRYLEKNKDATKDDIADFLDKFYKKVIDVVVQDTIDQFGDKLNAMEPSVLAADREVISDTACFFAKKQYIMSVIDNEGVRYKDTKIKMTGVEIKKSSIPIYIKEQFQEAVKLLLFKENTDIIKFIEDSKRKLPKQDVYKLAKTSTVNSLDYVLGEKSIPINSRASLVYNKYVLENNLEGTYELITPGDKIKLIYLDPANPTLNNIIAFKDPRFIELFKDYIDYNEVYQRFFLNSLSNMTEPLNWRLEYNFEDDEW